jgi:hypothetical protein
MSESTGERRGVSVFAHHTDGRQLEAPGADSFDVTEVGALMISRAGESVVAMAPRTWTLAYRTAENLLWHDTRPQVPAEPEKPFQMPFGVVDRKDVVAQRLRELDN